MTAAPGDRLKRLRMRSWRRGTRELDLMLGPFADAELEGLDTGALDALDLLLSENDQEVYQWIGGQCSIPAKHQQIIARIRAYHRIG